MEDAEAATGLRFTLSGPASGRGANDARFLPAVFEHYATGRNVWTGAQCWGCRSVPNCLVSPSRIPAGAPVRLDAITLHSKGEGTSYKVVEGEWAASALIRANSTWAAAGLGGLAISNDEARAICF